MSVTVAPAGIGPVANREGGGDLSGGAEAGTAPVVERFYKRHQSFKDEQAPPIDTEEIRDVFKFFDENHDGLISKEDLKQFMNRLGFLISEEDISMMVNSVDANGDGSVDFNEFATLYRTFSNEDAKGKEDDQDEDKEVEDDLKEAFLVFDKNSDGLISATELQDVLVNLGIHEGESITNCEKMIKSVDADGNGAVDFVEFKKMMGGEFGNCCRL